MVPGEPAAVDVEGALDVMGAEVGDGVVASSDVAAVELVVEFQAVLPSEPAADDVEGADVVPVV